MKNIQKILWKMSICQLNGVEERDEGNVFVFAIKYFENNFILILLL